MAGMFFLGRLGPMSPRNALTWSWLLVWSLVAFIWAFAEAIWFFIIVDVLISLAVMRFGVLRAMVPAFAALLGSLLGGIVLYKWAMVNPETVRELMLTVPGVPDELLSNAAGYVVVDPLQAMVVGGFTGIPLKVFAATSGNAGLTPVLEFVEPAAVARFCRFAVVLALSGALRSMLYSKLRRVGLIRLTLFIWVVFYAWFGYVFWNLV